MDAAVSKAHARAATAAVCRDETGNFFGSSARAITGIMDVVTLEVLACREGLALAEDLLL